MRSWITRRPVAAAALIPLALLAACTTEETGAPTGTTAATPTATPSFGAPAVPGPLDIAAFATDPCTSLTAEQQAEFGVDGGNERTVENGDKCDYAGGAFVSVLYSTEKSGLSYLYGLREDGVWARWEPLEVDGYPAVAYVKPASPEACDVAVGLSDTAYVSVGTSVTAGEDPCQKAREWATRVMETIKAGQ
jgi:hypothetical protein